jgi:hypothetical protein
LRSEFKELGTNTKKGGVCISAFIAVLFAR